MANVSRLLLFGGQGSLKDLFCPQGTSTAIHDAKSCPASAILLSKCHAVFLEDLQTLGTAKSTLFGHEFDLLFSPEKLLAPDVPYHDNPIIQGTAICLHQLLRYLSNLEEYGLKYESAFGQIVETAGFCSGILPAAVVASSPSIQEFIDHGVEAFRLAFWTGFQSAVYCERLLGRSWKDHPWSLVVYGLGKDQMLLQLRKFGNQTGCKSLNIAVISSDVCITLSGPGPDLIAFKAYCSAASSAKFAHVHALYHGGEQLQCVVKEVSTNLSSRGINFSSFTDLKKPIRSTLEGAFLVPNDVEKHTLVECLLRTLLVQTVDWSATSEEISKSIHKRLDRSSTMEIEIWSFGPSSTFLLSEIRRRQQHPRMQIADVSRPKYSSKLQEVNDTKDSIAIVGMAVNYPNGNGMDALWETLSRGLSAVEEVPESRFQLSQFYEPEASKAKGRKMTAKHGNFINDTWSFDNVFFNVSNREAKSLKELRFGSEEATDEEIWDRMDPQSRVLLHAAHAAMEDAGYAEDTTPSFQKKSFGCYIGAATGDYTDNLRNNIDVYYSPGTLRAFLSGKISYNYRLSGPSVVIDTACSSSLVAVHQACRAIQNGDCSSAIAGGVNTITSPDMYLGLARAHFLSPTGQCKSFDAAADGYCRAEGCGVFVLKRLSDAIAENDRIHGVIKGVEINQSGLAHSITHPHPETQAELFERLLNRTKTDPSTVSVVEAHGTGTQAGDFSEISSLHSVFAKSRGDQNPLSVSSIKGNIGHCEAASGSAGLAKLLLMLRQGTIPTQASLTNLNPRLTSFLSDGITIPRETQRWKNGSSLPRRALLNNFGAAGSNVALLLEEYVEAKPQRDDRRNRSSYNFNVSARTPWALQELVLRYQRYLKQKGPELDIRDVCYTATARRQIYEHRVSFTCSSVDDLLEQLDKVRLDQPRDKEESKPVVFIFSGQGASHFGMGRELIETSNFFKNTVKHCDKLIEGLGFPSVLHLLQSKDSNTTFRSESERIISFQCACVIIEYALARLWMSWNILPDIVLGHSLGEYAALAISGTISLEDSLRIVAHRAKHMTEACRARDSGMVACKFPTEQAQKLFTASTKFSDLTVACQNSTRDCVVAGPLVQLRAFQDHCSAAGQKTTKLEVPYGFHSAAMEPIVQPLKQLGESVRFFEPTITIASNVFGRLMTRKDLDASYFANHARQPVRFFESIQSLEQAAKPMDHAIFLEMGPHPITLPMIRATLLTDTHTHLPTLFKDREAWSSICTSLRQIFPKKDGILWRRVFDGTGAMLVDLPGHPLSTTEVIVPYQETISGTKQEEVADSDTKTSYTLLPELLKWKSTPSSFCFETHLFTLARYISGHSVGGIAMCPASVFHELVVEAAQSAWGLSADAVYVVCDMVFVNPLVYDIENERQPVHVVLSEILSTSDLSFKILSQSYGSRPETIHCSGTVSIENVSNVAANWVRKGALVRRQKAHLFADKGEKLNNFQRKMLYETVFSRVVEYSEEYQTLMSISVSESSGEGYGSFKMFSRSKTEKGITSPTFTDTLLHAAGFVANTSIRATDACICGKVESVRLLYGEIDYDEPMTVYCSLFDVDEGTVLADSYALDSTGRIIAAVEGMHFKKLRLSSFKAMLERNMGKPKFGETPSATEVHPASSDAQPLSTGSTSPSVPKDGVMQQQNIKAKVTRIIMASCELSEAQINADKHKDLKALGVDSLMILELASAVKKGFPDQSVEESTLTHCSIIHDLENAILSACSTPTTQTPDDASSTATTDSSPDVSGFEETSKKLMDQSPIGPGAQELKVDGSPVSVQKGDSTNASLYLFHDGSGLCNMYSQMHDIGRDTHGFSNPGFFEDDDQPSSLVHMAGRYAPHIDTSAKRPIILGGYSFGGVVAFELTRQLLQEGKQVKGVVLIDSPYPIDHEPLPDAIIAHITKSGSTNGSGSAGRQRVSAQFQANAALLGKYKMPPTSIAYPKVIMLRSRETLDCKKLCGVRYPWISEQEARSEALAAWEKLIGQSIQVLDIPGNHFEAFAPQNISKLSQQMQKACELIEAS